MKIIKLKISLNLPIAAECTVILALIIHSASPQTTDLNAMGK